MKIGVVYPQVELRGDVAAIAKFATAVEAQGYDYLLVYDHVLGASHDREPKLWGPYTENDPFHDPFIMFGYLAGITKKLELVTGVLILPQRQTALVAKQAADIDLLSGQRLRLGVGSGWNYVEYQGLGVDFATRGKRMDEQIDFMRKLWSEPLLTYHGQFEHLDKGNLNLRPKRQIPLFIGGFSEPAFRRGGRMGDGFMFVGGFDNGMQQWGRVQHHLKENNRPEAGFGRELIVPNGKGPQHAADTIKRWQEAGGTHACVPTLGKGYTDIGQHLDFVHEVKNLL
jgi:probable F420-dependent oxidoreductase